MTQTVSIVQHMRIANKKQITANKQEIPITKINHTGISDDSGGDDGGDAPPTFPDCSPGGEEVRVEGERDAGGDSAFFSYSTHLLSVQHTVPPVVLQIQSM